MVVEQAERVLLSRSLPLRWWRLSVVLTLSQLLSPNSLSIFANPFYSSRSPPFILNGLHSVYSGFTAHASFHASRAARGMAHGSGRGTRPGVWQETAVSQLAWMEWLVPSCPTAPSLKNSSVWQATRARWRLRCDIPFPGTGRCCRCRVPGALRCRGYRGPRLGPSLLVARESAGAGPCDPMKTPLMRGGPRAILALTLLM